MSDHLGWVKKAISKNLYAPFIIENDNSYYNDLKKRYKIFYDECKTAGADEKSLNIILKYSSKILEALRTYYKGKISSAHMMIKNLIKGCCESPIAVALANSSIAFPGVSNSELQLFRARLGEPNTFKAKEMLHLPYSLRSKTGNYRFSIPGVPSLYLGNSSYVCWLELGKPSEREFNVSPVVLDGTQKIFNLAVMNRDLHLLHNLDSGYIHVWLKLLILMVATSYRVKEGSRQFKSEYIISQSIMLACKELGLDGVAYYSKRVEDQMFAQPAINLALFTEYKYGQEYADVCKHIKVGDAFNYFIFQQIGKTNTDCRYELRCTQTGFVNNIGTYDRQYTYAMTNFCAFDKFLFYGWDKENIDWGNAL